MLLFVLMYIICWSGIDDHNDFCYFHSDDIEEEGKVEKRRGENTKGGNRRGQNSGEQQRKEENRREEKR